MIWPLWTWIMNSKTCVPYKDDNIPMLMRDPAITREDLTEQRRYIWCRKWYTMTTLIGLGVYSVVCCARFVRKKVLAILMYAGVGIKSHRKCAQCFRRLFFFFLHDLIRWAKWMYYMDTHHIQNTKSTWRVSMTDPMWKYTHLRYFYLSLTNLVHSYWQWSLLKLKVLKFTNSIRFYFLTLYMLGLTLCLYVSQWTTKGTRYRTYF